MVGFTIGSAVRRQGKRPNTPFISAAFFCVVSCSSLHPSNPRDVPSCPSPARPCHLGRILSVRMITSLGDWPPTFAPLANGAGQLINQIWWSLTDYRQKKKRTCCGRSLPTPVYITSPVVYQIQVRSHWLHSFIGESDMAPGHSTDTSPNLPYKSNSPWKKSQYP